MLFFFFNDTATTEIYTLSLHDALPIFRALVNLGPIEPADTHAIAARLGITVVSIDEIQNLSRESYDHLRSEEHTSELQSRQYLVCRLLLEKKKDTQSRIIHANCKWIGM